MVPDGGQGSRTALRNAGAGEIVEVPGGRIVRSAAGRKDRHSKVCTAKGPRDRRVRLAAHTAIQFYDVQDRLGYDRPSKAVDWLMKKAKSAIDALDELPTWKPISKNPDEEAAEVYGSNLLPPSMESDSIADTIKSFFPVGGEGSAAGAVSPVGVQPMQFQSYPSSDFLSPRDCNKSQDLKLSLQSLQDPMMMQSHHNNPRHSHQSQEEEQQSQFSEAAQIGFGNPSAGWDAEPQQQPDSGRFQRLIGWNLGGYGGGESGGGFMFIPPQNSLQQHPLLFSHGGGHSSSHLFSQGGPLQSNITTSATTTNSSQDHHHDHSVSIQPVSFPGITFSGFRIPARIQGDEEEQDGIPGKPFSLSSGSRH